MSDKMKAVAINAYGDVNELQDIDVNIPQVKQDEVLVHVAATSVNPVDVQLRSGQLKEGATSRSFPVILGCDIAGEVVATGADVTSYQKGNAVVGHLDKTLGAYAEFVAIKADLLAKKPRQTSFEAAAGVPHAALAAWQSLRKLDIKAGDKLLIQAGAGGVGTFAIQLAKSMGAYVATTSSERNEDVLYDLGADQVIDYHHAFLTEEIADFDAVLDTIDHVDEGLYVLNANGRLVTLVGNPMQRQMTGHPTANALQMHPSGTDLQKLMHLFEQDQLKTVIDTSYPMDAEGVALAHTQSANHHVVGKLILTNENFH